MGKSHKKTDQETQSPMIKLFQKLKQREEQDPGQMAEYKDSRMSKFTCLNVAQDPDKMAEREKRRIRKKKSHTSRHEIATTELTSPDETTQDDPSKVHKKDSTQNRETSREHKSKGSENSARPQTENKKEVNQRGSDYLLQRGANKPQKEPLEPEQNRSKRVSQFILSQVDMDDKDGDGRFACPLKNLLSNEYACVGCLLFIFTVTVITAFLLVFQTMPVSEAGVERYTPNFLMGRRNSFPNAHRRDSEHFERKINEMSKDKKRSVWDDSLNEHIGSLTDIGSIDTHWNYAGSIDDQESIPSMDGFGLSSYADKLRFGNAVPSGKLRDFYTKLMKAERMIKKLKRSGTIRTTPYNREFLNSFHYKKHPKFKRHANLPHLRRQTRMKRKQRTMKHETKDVLSENKAKVEIPNDKKAQKVIEDPKQAAKEDKHSNVTEPPGGVIVENRKVVVKYKPIVTSNLHQPKSAHGQTEAKTNEHQLKQPHFKHSHKLDELLDKVLGTSFKDIIGQTIGSDFSYFKNGQNQGPDKQLTELNKINPIKIDDLWKKDSAGVETVTVMETFQVTSMPYVMKGVSGSPFRANIPKPIESATSLSTKFTVAPPGGRATFREYYPFRYPEEMKTDSDLENVRQVGRKLLQMSREEEETLAYEDLMEVLSDEQDNHDDSEGWEDRRKREKVIKQPVAKNDKDHEKEKTQHKEETTKNLHQKIVNTESPKQEQKVDYERSTETTLKVNEKDSETTKKVISENNAEIIQRADQMENEHNYGTQGSNKLAHGPGVQNVNWKGPMPLYEDELNILTAKHIFTVQRAHYPINRTNNLVFMNPNYKMNALNSENTESTVSENKKAKSIVYDERNKNQNNVSDERRKSSLPDLEYDSKNDEEFAGDYLEPDQVYIAQAYSDYGVLNENMKPEKIKDKPEEIRATSSPKYSKYLKKRFKPKNSKIRWDFMNPSADEREGFVLRIGDDDSSELTSSTHLVTPHATWEDLDITKSGYAPPTTASPLEKTTTKYNFKSPAGVVTPIKYDFKSLPDLAPASTTAPIPLAPAVIPAVTPITPTPASFIPAPTPLKTAPTPFKTTPSPFTPNNSAPTPTLLPPSDEEIRDGVLKFEYKDKYANTDVYHYKKPNIDVQYDEYAYDDSEKDKQSSETKKHAKQKGNAESMDNAERGKENRKPNNIENTEQKVNKENNDYKEQENINDDALNYGYENEVPENIGINDDLNLNMEENADDDTDDELSQRNSYDNPNSRVKRNVQPGTGLESEVSSSSDLKEEKRRSGKTNNTTTPAVFTDANKFTNNTNMNKTDLLMILSKWFSAMVQLTSEDHRPSSKREQGNICNESAGIEINDTIEAMESNIKHKSRTLLSIEENTGKVPELVKEESKSEKTINIVEKTSPPPTTTPAKNITKTTVKHVKSVAENATKKVVINNNVEAKSSNKTVVKRSPSGVANLIFWNEIYDEEYGVLQDPLDKTQDKCPVTSNKNRNALKNYANWFGNKVKSIKSTMKKSKARNKKKTTLSKRFHRDLKKMGGYIPDAFRSSLKKLTSASEYSQAALTTKKNIKTEPRKGVLHESPPFKSNLDFKQLTENMKVIFKEAVDSMKNTRNLVVRQDDSESEAARGLMENLVKLMSDLVDYQVNKRTCVSLPADLRDFLDWLTLPDDMAKKKKKTKDKYEPDAAATRTRLMHNLETITKTSTEKEYEKQDTRSECLGTINAVAELLQQYDDLSDVDKSKMAGVKEYLQDQLKFLNKRLTLLSLNNRQQSSYFEGQDLTYRYKRNANKRSIKKLGNAGRINRDVNKKKPKSKHLFMTYGRRRTKSTASNTDSIPIDISNKYTRSVLNDALFENKMAYKNGGDSNAKDGNILYNIIDMN